MDFPKELFCTKFYNGLYCKQFYYIFAPECVLLNEYMETVLLQNCIGKDFTQGKYWKGFYYRILILRILL